MNADQRLLAVGIYINSALYCAGVFIAGLHFNNGWAWKTALLTVALCYLTYLAQLAQLNKSILAGLVLSSIIVGGFAGTTLLLV